MGAKFDHFAVIVGGSVGEDGLRLGDAESFVEIKVIERRVEMEFGCVAIEEGAVGFGDGDDLDFRPVEGMGEEAVGVAVHESGDGYAEWMLGVDGESGGIERGGEEKRKSELCGETKESGWHRCGSRGRKIMIARGRRNWREFGREWNGKTAEQVGSSSSSRFAAVFLCGGLPAAGRQAIGAMAMSKRWLLLTGDL